LLHFLLLYSTFSPSLMAYKDLLDYFLASFLELVPMRAIVDLCRPRYEGRHHGSAGACSRDANAVGWDHEGDDTPENSGSQKPRYRMESGTPISAMPERRCNTWLTLLLARVGTLGES